MKNELLAMVVKVACSLYLVCGQFLSLLLSLSLTDDMVKWTELNRAKDYFYLVGPFEHDHVIRRSINPDSYQSALTSIVAVRTAKVATPTVAQGQSSCFLFTRPQDLISVSISCPISYSTVSA